MRSDCMDTAKSLASEQLATEKVSLKGKLFRTLNEGWRVSSRAYANGLAKKRREVYVAPVIHRWVCIW